MDIYCKVAGDRPIGSKEKQDFFGEMALLSDDKRNATCVAATPVTCYVLNRGDFNRVMGPLRELDQPSPNRGRSMITSNTVARKNKVKYELRDLDLFNCLGEGAFGKVRLVKAKTTGKYYAMKMTRKERIIKMELPNDVLNEYKVLKDLSHPNILTVSSTFISKTF